MPKRIGKYEITSEIGRGGFSRVYRGFDPNVNRPVAIKVSTRESDPEHLSRFRNEASAAGNLRHENIVTIHDYGDDDGVPYLVMELLDGRDLHHIMRDGPKMSLLEKMQVMSQVAEGLSCAHANGVVHRDIKPANIMVLTDGTVKILDFGIARMTGEVSRLTQSGYLVGTPLYMSPEQLQGSDADALGDVWAYGVLYFELLTGQHPFLSQDNTRLIRNIQIVNPPSVHSLTRGVPEGLAQVIRRALTKDRRRRYQSLEEVLVDTNPILALLQREQTTGLVSEAQFYRNTGQLAAARQSSRRALEIDPSNLGAQQLLKSIQHEMHAESLATPEVPAPEVATPPAAAAEVTATPAPPAPVRVVPPPPMRTTVPSVSPIEAARPEPVPAPPAPKPIQQTPASMPPTPPAPMPLQPAAQAIPVPAAATPAPPTPAHTIAPAIAALARTSTSIASNGPSVALQTPPSGPSTTQRLRPGAASGAAAAIAAAVAAAKARQAQEERQEKPTEKLPEESAPAVPAIKATPLVVSAPATSRIVPAAQSAASSLRRADSSGAFLTDDPLVVKRPAAAVMTQRIRSAEATASAAVATPVPAPAAPAPPPTRLPGTRAIPTSVSRSSNGTAEAAPPAEPGTSLERRPSENLPMRRPPAEIYSKAKRRTSSAMFVEKKDKKSFPWIAISIVTTVAVVVSALIWFAMSAPKLANAPELQPGKLSFHWQKGTPAPPEQILRIKGGSASTPFSASSSNEEWLTVTPVSEEPTNRAWIVRVDGEAVGPTGPKGVQGWIDVVSTDNEGIRLPAVEATLVVDPGAAGSPKGKKGAAAAAPAVMNPPAALPAAAANGAQKKAAATTATATKPTAPAATTTSTKPATPAAASTKPAAPAATSTKPAAPAPKPTATKKPATNDGIDIN